MKLLDTSVVADIDRGGVDEKVRALDAEGRHAISMVTVTELRLGVELQYDRDTQAYQDAIDALDRLVSRFDVLPIARPVATAAAETIADLRADGQRLDDLHDVYIGATARTEQLPVVTANVDQFERIDGVRAVDWEQF
ncbi:PilT protein domain-containing protein [Halorubrum californiense DSM 19288]|uniref:Ribonuclease VapC n=1 Tax=Halorubrum californiense DSM 19288 TaxID=1227465 RepID=M0DZL0_9EURY|nr:MULTISPECIES: type II toxin-antitoxin system VapC family toxin [Halorubrum]ELZ40248.1 PilT protein domain-containing protein [Halorubrum californiense DSM 19288]TKX68508.1 type II toxin-antitoxin system VapC family toxin [Halorubrum sp. GN11GM_10-3_MGM]